MITWDILLPDLEQIAEQYGFLLTLHAVDRPECAGGELQLCIEKNGMYTHIPPDILHCTDAFHQWLCCPSTVERFD